VRLALAAVLAGPLGGCSGSGPASFNPVDWWHGMEGGPIAETRPPPPNADAPYPSLGGVPAKPAPPDAAAHARIAGALVADRANAVYDASVTPIPTLPPATVRPAPHPVAGGDTDQANASLPAATAPPAPAPGSPVAHKAPVGPVTAAALPAPAEMPTIPDAPPPAPQIAGIAVPAVTAPTLPPATPPAPPPPPPKAGAPVAIPFAAGSSILPAAGLAPVKLLATQRGNATIAVTGFGEATSTDPAAQSAALPLALERARAVAAALLADGVPSAAVRIAAEPQGSGAAATLIR